MLLILGLLACSSSPSSGSFRALSYNVQGLPDGVTEYEHTLLERMALIAPHLEPYDLVGLQEDFDAQAHAALVSSSTHPVQEHFDDVVDDSRVYGSGLSLLAKLPVVDVFSEHYTACNGLLDGASDCLASKGFQVLRLQLGEAELDLYNTHHEAGGGPDDLAARLEQVNQVLSSMETRSEGRAVLLLGDTNLRPSDPDDGPALQAYYDAGLRDACDEVGCDEPDHIDRFLLRDSDALRLSVTTWTREEHFVDEVEAPLSDHPPISAVFDWMTTH